MQRVIDRYSIKACFAAIIAAGAIVRVIAALFSHGHGFDLDILGDWGWTLKFYRTDEFYYVAKNPDHLPGDLWFHWALSTAFQSFGGSHYWGTTYYFLLRMLPSIADAVAAYLIFDIVRNLVSARSGLIGAALYFLNPAVLFVSSVWGQWDSVSMMLLLAGLAVVIGRPDRWLLAVPLIAWATVVKPPLALPGVIILATPLLLTIRDSQTVVQGIRRIVLPALAAGALGVITIIAISAPFSVGLPGMTTNWTIFERAQIALDMYPYKVLGAGNFWMLMQGSFEMVDDRGNGVFGINSHDLGNVYLALSSLVVFALFVYLLYTVLSERPYVAMTWAALAITFATYMVPTRVHERYLFPAIVFMVLLLAIAGVNQVRFAGLAIVSATFLANLAFVYFGFHTGFRVDYGDAAFAALLRTTSVLNIIAFIAVALIPLGWIRGPKAEGRAVNSFRPLRNASVR